MKIGVLSQRLHRNYGGLLQAWALQQVLIGMGHAPELIFRNHDASRLSLAQLSLNCLSLAKRILRMLVSWRYVCLNNPFHRAYSGFPRFADKNFVNKIHKSKELFLDSELRTYIERSEFDAFIVGSDQVWREDYSPRIETYFLDFLKDSDKRKKIAYAASFGKRTDYISSDKMPECSKLLRRFDAVSVREISGVDIVRNDFGREDVDHVLDPTLLIDRERYIKLINIKDRFSRQMISYILDEDDEKLSVEKEISSFKKLNVDKFSTGENQNSGEEKRMLTMSQWLASFYDGRFVFTDSFHGMVFSIIFNKDFVVYANRERGMDRFESLLEDFDLRNRMIYSHKDFESRFDELMSPIDYNTVNEKLDKLRKKSVDWLLNALAD